MVEDDHSLLAAIEARTIAVIFVPWALEVNSAVYLLPAWSLKVATF